MLARESLNLALPKLRTIITGLPRSSPERKRAEHTLKSVEGALASCGTHGAPPGKYAVNVEGYARNSTAPYTQNEGVPVEELINILGHSTDPDTQALRQKLLDNSETYFEAHYTGAHATDSTVWTQAEKDKQDLRTRLEAKLISHDYRSTGDEGDDYKKAMEALRARRELKLTPPPAPPQPPQNPTTGSLDQMRDQYLHAKRLRGNVFRGKIMGGLFGRKLNVGGNNQPGAVLFAGQDMYFGGKQGATELETVRTQYQDALNQHRVQVLQTLEQTLDQQVTAGTLTPAGKTAQMQTRMIELLEEEDVTTGTRAKGGIEKNFFEKFKTAWRRHSGKRLIGGLLLSGTAIATGGTAVGAGIVVTRAAVGTVGTYISTEAALERYTSLLGHKNGLVRRISKMPNSVTGQDRNRLLASLPQEEIRQEAARLRMLQVEKGVPIGQLATLGDDGAIAALILQRDNELAAQEAMQTAGVPGAIANLISARLATEINCRNQTVESAVNTERKKKMARKIIATVAGATSGWLIGGKLLDNSSTSSGLPKPPDAPPHNLPDPLAHPSYEGNIAGDGLPINDHPYDFNMDVVHKNEGIEHVFRRQIEHDSVLAGRLGYHGAPGDTKALHEFSGGAAHKLAIDEGYVDKATGEEIRVGPVDELAYKIKLEGDTIKVDEIRVHGGFQEGHQAGASFEGTQKDSYEYRDYPHHGPAHPAPVETLSNPKHTFIQPEEHGKEPLSKIKLGETFEDYSSRNVPRPATILTAEEIQNNLAEKFKMYDHDTTTLQGGPGEVATSTSSPFTAYETALQEQAGVVANTNGISIEEARAMLEEPTLKSMGFTGDVTDKVAVREYLEHMGPEKLNAPREVMQHVFFDDIAKLPREAFNKLIQTDQYNLSRIFPTNTNDPMEMWGKVSQLKVNNLFSTDPSVGIGHLTGTPLDKMSKYLTKLYEVTGEKPRTGVIFGVGAENVEDYIKRALVKAAQVEGGLDAVKIK